MTERSMPLVTVAISTYERAEGTFPAALRSAVAQTWPNLEILIADNASQDHTRDVVAELGDSRVRYHRHQENIGPAANFNFCIEAARGRYFVLLHDDDLLDADFVERYASALAARPEAGLATGGVRVIDGHGRVRNRKPNRVPEMDAADLFLTWFDKGVSFYLCSTMFHRQRLLDAGGFVSPKHLFQDVKAIAILAARHGYVSVPGTASSFRRHASNRGGLSRALDWVEDSLHLLDTICDEMPDRAAELRAAGLPYLSQKCYRYVAAAPSLRERVQLAFEIYRRFGRTYGPGRYLAEQWTRRPRRALRRVTRGRATSPKPSTVE